MCEEEKKRKILLFAGEYTWKHYFYLSFNLPLIELYHIERYLYEYTNNKVHGNIILKTLKFKIKHIFFTPSFSCNL